MINAHEETFNIWDVNVELKEDGAIYYWDSKLR